ncbi:MAG: ABC transporter ATP-binding protein [Firmicutes bacterium]|nr:ABC transporter ATP-binding protein [Bacillota bacterium]
MSESIIDISDMAVVRNGRFLLEGVTWQVRAGEHWALLGANGAGKTTLLQTLMGYLWPTSGRVNVLSHTLGSYDVRELRKEIGFVSVNMDARLSPTETVLAIALTGLSASYELYQEPSTAQIERAHTLLAHMGVDQHALRPYQSLSQGERQKVLIARALMASPRLLILDEPCGGLDFPSREQLLSALEDVLASPGAPQLIYVTHYPDELIPSMTHALLLAQGKVVASGPKETVLAPDPLATAFGVPVSVVWQEGYPIVRMLRGQ